MQRPAPPVMTTATTYTVSCLPDDQVDGGRWTITVRFIGAWSYREPRPRDQQWVVEHRGFYLDRDGGWWSPPRTDEQWERHRFSFEDAMRLAQEHAPKLKINGLTVTDVIERRARRAAEPGRRRKLYCKGRRRDHYDGTWDCTLGAECTGDVQHESGEWHQPGRGLTSGCWCVSGDVTARIEAQMRGDETRP